MSKKRLPLDRTIPGRVLLAKEFLLSQSSVPVDRKALRVELHAFAKKSKQSILRSDELLAAADEISGKDQVQWRRLCRKRSIRSESGVSVVAILTRDFGCPGKCVYCPTPANMPKSYLPNEPAVMRAIGAKFSPSEQVRRRLRALKNTGHDPSKVEIIIMGGTWSAIPHSYQTSYIRACYHALNDESEKRKVKREKQKIGRMMSLEDLQKQNESAPHRCVGLTLETRPDWVTPEEIKRMRMFGCTRVEMGVQTLDDEVHRLTKRGHGVADVVRATKLLRDAGFKIVYHMMLNLPGSTPKKDIESMKQIFADPRFRPDQIKIYPCVLVADAELVEWHKDGRWKPYTEKQLVETIIAAKKFIPEYCRVIRIIRDIPSSDIIAGSKVSNLRQLLHQKGMTCRCIRCREIRDLTPKKCELVMREFEASDGKEIFLSYEDPVQDKLIALLRLRIPLQCLSFDCTQDDIVKLFPVLRDAAVVRELHVYGLQTAVGKKGKSAQHTGLGKKLLAEAEKIAKKNGAKKIAVIAGVGVRDYYRKQGYRLKEGYMVKHLEV